MLNCIRTTSHNPDFAALVVLLDADLRVRDGEEHAFYAQYNKTDAIKHVVVAYNDNVAVGCGAIKEFSGSATEVKRMYVVQNKRGTGIATAILQELEKWAAELKYSKCILETGKKQPEAIALYLKNGYTVIPNYGQYAGVENSVCFEKLL